MLHCFTVSEKASRIVSVEEPLFPLSGEPVFHSQARIASLAGEGFYTIGPCGEEALLSGAHAVQDKIMLALHYRHLGVNLARQFHANNIQNNYRIFRCYLPVVRKLTVSGD
jgi:hypothetical protein